MFDRSSVHAACIVVLIIQASQHQMARCSDHHHAWFLVVCVSSDCIPFGERVNSVRLKPCVLVNLALKHPGKAVHVQL
jgi:hypothetical protein